LTHPRYICEGCGNDLPESEGKAMAVLGYLLCAECREQALTLLALIAERQVDLVSGPGRYLRNDNRPAEQAQQAGRPF
jgi:hypothetical protein